MADIHTPEPPADVADFGGTGTSSPSNSGDNGATPLIEQAKEHTRRVVEQTQQKAGEVVGQARDRTTTWLEEQKNTAAGSLGNIASAVRQTGQQLRRQGQTETGKIAEFAEGSADAVEKASSYLRDTSVDQMVGQVESYARREPVLFLAIAMGLGFLAGRFLKSSGRNTGSSQYAYNPDRRLPVVSEEQNRGVGINNDTTSPAG